MKTTLHNPKPSKRDDDDIVDNIVVGIATLISFLLVSIANLQFLKYAVNYVTSNVEIKVIQVQEKK